MARNVWLAYILAAFKNSWFFLGVWVLYYLRFTDYAGIGILETIGIATTTIAEIPTGAIADLFGKKKTLILAFVFETVGGVIWCLTQDFYQLALSLFIMFIGGALYSGTLDALIFDSLKVQDKEDRYDKVIANVSTISLIAIAAASIAGGYLYVLNYRLPFIAYASVCFFGLLTSLFLTEPKIDTVKFSFSNYWQQTKIGFRELFSSGERKLVINLLILGGALVVLDEMMEAFLLVEFGFEAKALGILYSVIYILSASSSQLSPWLKRKMKPNLAIFLIGLIVAISLIISPYVGLVLGGLMVLLRYNLAPIFNNLSLEMVNRSTESKFRATTISTFNMLKNLPYVLSAAFIGYLMDIMSARTFALYFGLLLAGLIFGVRLINGRKTLSA